MPDCVRELDGVLDPVCVGVREPLKDALPLLEEDAPLVREAVGDTELVLLEVIVVVGLAEGVPLLVAVGEPDGVPDPL